MLDFLSEQKRDILWKYPFIRDFDRNPRKRERFLTDLSYFSPQLKEAGIKPQEIATLLNWGNRIYHHIPVPFDSIDAMGSSPLYENPLWQHPVFDNSQRVVRTLHAFDFLVNAGTKVLSIGDGTVTCVKVDSNISSGQELCLILYNRQNRQLEDYVRVHKGLISSIVDESSDVRDALNDMERLRVALTKYFFNKMNVIVIKHKKNIYSQYVHLAHEGNFVRVGQNVKMGELIGFSGDSGYAQYPHLHVDLFTPKKGVRYMGGRFISAQEEESIQIKFPPEVVEF